MPYDRNRAIELGKLVDFAYQQYGNRANAAFAWQPPGYQIVQVLTRTQPAPAVPFGYVATQGTARYVVIRGTEQPLEWLDDELIKPIGFRSGWGSTTFGFLEIYNQISPQILGAVRQLRAQNAFTEIFVTGHSLGAALAQLAAADILFDTFVIPTLYTFCGPRAGDAAFVSTFQASKIESWRIFNTEDIVPGLPLATLDLNVASSGLADTPVELAVKMLVNLVKFAFTHVQTPVAVSFNTGTIAGNHNLANVYNCL
jgi:triacylglycerol lipase